LPGARRASSHRSPPDGVPDALIAEPGFSRSVRVKQNGRERTLLFDTGVSPGGVAENMAGWHSRWATSR
jgi:metal-dependent hydrolase (beta-lactamase superfamily II)